MGNRLYYGDNLHVLRESIADESVDLIYLDPPFNSNASYNVLFKAPGGAQSQAQIEAFDDTWHWNESAALAFDEVMTGGHSEAAIMLRAMRSALGENDMMAYLAMMAVRLLELRRVLKPTGSIYLHCDTTVSAYLKILLDGIFGPEMFRNEIIWARHNARSVRQTIWPRLHDVILHYGNGEGTIFTTTIVPSGTVSDPHDLVRGPDGLRYRTRDLTGAGIRTGETGRPWRGVNPTDQGRHWRIMHAALNKIEAEGRIHMQSGGMPRERDAAPYVPEERMAVVGDVWTDIPSLNSGAAERLGYPTQKPVALLERIIEASSAEEAVVLDPFCGCGTTVHAAQKLKRRWIGIDITHLSIALIERRLKDAFPGIGFTVHGVPKDTDGARDLAERDKHEFQKWIVANIGGQPYKSGKKGMDRGIDGYLHFRDAANKPQFAIVSVKGGGIKSGDIRDLKGTMEREGAPLGVFLTLKEPTREMEREAAAAGFYESCLLYTSPSPRD